MANAWLDTVLPIIVGAVAQRAMGTGSGDTPNVYPIALTPEQKRQQDEIYRVYQQGGSDVQRMVRQAAANAIDSTPTMPPNFQFRSEALQGQPFAGGLQIPKFNIGAMLSNIATPSRPAVERPERPDIQTGRQDAPTAGEAPRSPGFGGEGSGFPTPDPNGLSRMMDNLPPAEESKIQQGWAEYRSKNPDWITKGTAAAAGFLSVFTGLNPATIHGWLSKWFGSSPESPLGGGPYPRGGPAVNRDIPTTGMPVDPNYRAPWPSLGATAPTPFSNFFGGLQNLRVPAGWQTYQPDAAGGSKGAGRPRGLY